MACGAIAVHVSEAAHRHGWPVDVHPLPPLLHNRPDRIAQQVRVAVLALRPRFGRIAVAYADCGTYGALDAVCAELGVPRLRGENCYELFAGRQRLRAELAAEPGTYLLTDFLVRSFRRTVVAELGLDLHPDLREDYFRHYRRVVWLAQHRTPELDAAAADAAGLIGLPLEVRDVGAAGLEEALATLLTLDLTC